MRSGFDLRSLLGSLVLLPLMGCATGAITGVLPPDDPQSPALNVSVRAEGLNHKAELCELEVFLSDYYCLRKIPLNPQGPDPQQVSFDVTEWKEYKDLPTDPRSLRDRERLTPAKELMRVRFLFNKHAVLDEKVIARPEFNPYPPGKGPKLPDRPPPQQQDKPPAQEPPRQVKNVLAEGTTLGRSPESATPFPFRNGAARIECRVRSATTPQYARLEPPPGNVKLVVKVRSLATPGQSTWWRLELLDKEGNSLPEPVQEFQFIESGNHARAELEWPFDGNAHILKLSSGSEEGDDITVDCTLVDSGIPR